MISQFPCRSFIHALTEHYPEPIARKEAPPLRVDRILLESENVRVVTSRRLEITDRQYAPGIDDLSHAVLWPTCKRNSKETRVRDASRVGTHLGRGHRFRS